MVAGELKTDINALSAIPTVSFLRVVQPPFDPTAHLSAYMTLWFGVLFHMPVLMKALLPIEVTALGMEIEVREVAPAKAELPIV
jgi:hypothetical protein